MFQSGEFSLRDYLEMLLRRRWLILGITLAGLLAGLIPASLQDPVYASTATIRLRETQQISPFDDRPENLNAQTRDLVTDTEVIMSPDMRAAVIERLGPEANPFDDVFAGIILYTELIEITVVAPSAAAAAEAANAYADEYVETVRESAVNALERQTFELRGRVREDTERQVAIDTALSAPDLSPVEHASLQQERANLALQIASFSARADQLEVEIALRQEKAAVTSRAQIDYSPIGPGPFVPALIGFVLGFLISLCLAVVRELLRDRISTPSALEGIDPDLRILAAVPHADTDLDDPRTAVPRPVHEAVRYLRTGLRVAGLDHPYSSFLVSSSLAEEGKTTTAVQLADSLAEDGVRVVLVDADTRNPSIHSRLGLDNELGLSSVLAGDASFSDVVQYVRPTLAVVPAGPASETASELLRSYRFEQMIKHLSEQSDLVIVDTPPVLPVADALEVSRVVDAAVLVVRVDRIRRRDVVAAVRRFRDARVRLLGYVANDLSAATTSYDRYGGYGYQYPSAIADETDVDDKSGPEDERAEDKSDALA